MPPLTAPISAPKAMHHNDHHRQRQAEDQIEIEREKIRHREDGADRKVDAAREHRERHRDRHEALLGKIEHQLLQVAQRSVVRDCEREDQKTAIVSVNGMIGSIQRFSSSSPRKS